MGIGKDCAIFMNINSDKYTDEEKVSAICSVVEMPTHNGVTKDAMLEVIRYALRRTAEDDKAREEGRFVELPCKVGDILYTESHCKGLVKKFAAPDLQWIIENTPLFGKTIFFTHQEAEAALSEGGGEDIC